LVEANRVGGGALLIFIVVVIIIIITIILFAQKHFNIWTVQQMTLSTTTKNIN